MPLSISRDPAQPHTLLMRGDTFDFVKVFRLHNFGGRHEASIEVFGLEVGDVKADSQHDKLPAIRMSLLDSLGSREVGRLVVQHRRDFREELPEWRVIFVDEETAAEVLEAYQREPQPNDVVSVELDVSFDEPDPKRVLAEWTAAYGVSFHVVNPFGPGGGNPVIEVSGLRHKVLTWMRTEYCDANSEPPEFYLG